MLFIKMIRDLKKNIVQFLTIFIMAFICMFVVTGLGVCEYDSINRYLVDTNYRDLDVQGIPIYNENIEALRQLEEINAVDACYSTVGKLHLEKDIKMLFDFISGNDVSQMFLLEGVPYEPGESGIWLDASMCEVQNIKCGDTVSINVDGKQIIEEVKGLVASPTYIYYVVDSSYAEPLYGEYGFGYMDIKEYAGTQTVYNRLLVDVAGVNNQLYLTEEEDKYVENARKKIAAILDDENLAFINKKQDVSLKTYVESLDSNSAMLHVFPVFFGLIAMLGIMTTMTRLVARQRTTIGAMKALGFTSKIITMHYMSYSVIIVLIGAVTGAVSGYYILGNIMIEEYEYYYLNPYLEMPVAKVVYVAALLLIAAAVLVGYLGNYKILSLSASQILQPEAPKNTKQSWYEGLFIWKKLKFSVRWNVRDVTNNIFRTLMSIFGVVLCSALIFAAIGFLECIKHQVEWQYSGLIKAQSKISFVDDTPYSTVYEYAREYDGQMIQQNSIVFTGHENDDLTMTVVDKGHNFFINDVNEEYFKLPDKGIGVSYKFHIDGGIDIGDIVSWKIQGNKELYSGRISFIYRDPMYQGILMSREQFENIKGEFKPIEIYTNCDVKKEIEERAEIDGVNSVEKMKSALSDIYEANYTIIEILILVAVILGVSILYNLGSLSYSEKIRDLATLKVLGFGSGELKSILMQQNLMITGIGSLLGIPLGFKVLELLTTILGETVDCMLKIDIIPYLVELVVTFVMSILINSRIVSKLEEIDMVEALKGV